MHITMIVHGLHCAAKFISSKRTASLCCIYPHIQDWSGWSIKKLRQSGAQRSALHYNPYTDRSDEESVMDGIPSSYKILLLSLHSPQSSASAEGAVVDSLHSSSIILWASHRTASNSKYSPPTNCHEFIDVNTSNYWKVQAISIIRFYGTSRVVQI